MVGTINRYRAYKGKQPISAVDKVVSHYCKLHCLAMSREKNIYHTPDYYLNDWQEAVAVVPYDEHWLDQVIFDVLGRCNVHASVLLDCNEIACDYHIDNYMVYVCVRGR